MNKKRIIYIVTIILAVLYIFIGNKVISKNANKVASMEDTYTKAKVVNILSKTEESSLVGLTDDAKDITIEFEAKLLGGENKGEIIQSEQIISYPNAENAVKLKKGDKILVIKVGETDSGDIWKYIDRARINPVIFLGVIFLLLLILFGKKKGISTILALAFNVCSVFIVFVPSILAGYNVYLFCMITCVYIILTTIIIVYGIDKKSIATALGCFAGILLSIVILVIMDSIIHISGYTSEESMFMVLLDIDNPINLKAIVFASIIIGAIGAIMDISIDIASSLREIANKIKEPSFKEIFKSGITIGQDIIATMTNTLILAYVGSSLSGIILIVAYNTSMINLFNKEAIIIEILQALVGSLGLLFTIPFTSAICGIMYSSKGAKHEIVQIKKKLMHKVKGRREEVNE